MRRRRLTLILTLSFLLTGVLPVHATADSTPREEPSQVVTGSVDTDAKEPLTDTLPEADEKTELPSEDPEEPAETPTELPTEAVPETPTGEQATESEAPTEPEPTQPASAEEQKAEPQPTQELPTEAPATEPTQKEPAQSPSKELAVNNEEAEIVVKEDIEQDSSSEAIVSYNHPRPTLDPVDPVAIPVWLQTPDVKIICTESAIVLKWNAVSGADGYAVYSLKDGSWELIGTTKNTGYILNDIENGQEYSFVVRCLANGGTRIADAALALAYRTLGESRYDEGTPLYQVIHALANGKRWGGGNLAESGRTQSCDQGACTIVSYSGADDLFPCWCGYHFSYFNSDRGKSYWKEIEDWTLDDLQPGDVGVWSNEGHVFVYVGFDAASKYWTDLEQPDSNHDYIVDSGYHSHRSLSLNMSSITSGKVNGVRTRFFRNIKIEDESKFDTILSSAQVRALQKVYCSGSWAGTQNLDNKSGPRPYGSVTSAKAYAQKIMRQCGVEWSDAQKDPFAGIDPSTVVFFRAPEPKLIKDENSTSVYLSWDAIDGVARYRIYTRLPSGKWYPLGDSRDTLFNITHFSDPNLCFIVRCVSDDGGRVLSSIPIHSIGLHILFQETV